MQSNNSSQDREITTILLQDLIKERRSDRRWRNFRFFFIFGLIAFFILLGFMQTGAPVVVDDEGKGYVSLIRLNGMIGPGQDFSSDTVLPILHDAFADKEAKGVVLDINSGGGTPVQAAIIHDAIVDLKKKYHKKVIVVGEDTMASGAYFVAVAADKIYVNPNTITGSIGVIMKEFGFPDLIKKLGIDRRVYASGANKDRLDEFLPQNQEDVAKIRQVIGEIHSNFIQVVQQGRQGKLQADPDLFTGDFWSGQSALKIGLVDGLGNLTDVLHNEFQTGAYKDYSKQLSLVKSALGQVGSSLDWALTSSHMHVLEKI